MREYEIKEVTKKEELLTKITCNQCGKESEETTFDPCIKSFSVGFGYGSIFDMERWCFELCEDCLIKLVSQFKHVPEGFREDNHSRYEQKEQHQALFDNWKKTGAWEELMCKSYEELVNLNGWYDTDYINDYIRTYHPDKPLLKEDE